VGLLNDSIVNAAQRLLKEQFPALGSLQDVALGLIMNFQIESGDFIQIIHSNFHWLISSIGMKSDAVQVFDSLYTSISAMVKSQIANLFSTQNSKIEVRIMDIQTQV
jgi:Ulp1 family protease